jgi:hypothetical protein
MNEHLHDEASVRGHAAWWANPEDVREVGRMLMCAGIIIERDLEYYESKPWKWSGERQIVKAMQIAFDRAGVTFEKGIDMTGRRLLESWQEKQRSGA